MSATSRIAKICNQAVGAQPACAGENPFVALRRDLRSGIFDTSGYWSYPSFVFGEKGNLCWLYIVLGTVVLPKKRKTALLRPKAIVTTLAESNVVIEYANLHLSKDPFAVLRWDEPIGIFPHSTVGCLSYHELQERENKLVAMYHEAGDMFRTQRILPIEFCTEYLALSHPAILGFLKHLAPTFVKALGAAPP